MFKAQKKATSKATASKQVPQSKAKSPLTTQKRKKTWKRKQEKLKDGLPKGLQTTKPGALTQVLHDRKLVRECITSYNEITPRSEWRCVPAKENGWKIEAADPIPKDLHRRVLSYADQFDTPIRPKQVINHFVNHPTAPVPKHHVYTMMTNLVKLNNITRYSKVDEEGNIHWFVGTTNNSRLAHNLVLHNLIKTKRPLPIDEVVWETIGEQADSFENLRLMPLEDQAAFFAMKKAKDAAALAKV